jgi:hypothetical protein
MDKLCFGTFARAMQTVMQPPNSNQAVVELLLGLIADMATEGQLSQNFTIKPTKVNALLHFKEDVHGDIVALSASDKVIKSMPDAISKFVIPSLKSVLIDDYIASLCKLINDDRSISEAKRKHLLALSDDRYLLDYGNHKMYTMRYERISDDLR